jgi:hypothetical protein
MRPLVPPIWFRVMQPCLDAWDARLASTEELALLGAARPPVATEARGA